MLRIRNTQIKVFEEEALADFYRRLGAYLVRACPEICKPLDANQLKSHMRGAHDAALARGMHTEAEVAGFAAQWTLDRGKPFCLAEA